jgi:hypothetical protein
VFEVGDADMEAAVEVNAGLAGDVAEGNGVSVESGEVAVITMGVGSTDPGRLQATMKRIKNPKGRSRL